MKAKAIEMIKSNDGELSRLGITTLLQSPVEIEKALISPNHGSGDRQAYWIRVGRDTCHRYSSAHSENYYVNLENNSCVVFLFELMVYGNVEAVRKEVSSTQIMNEKKRIEI